MTAPTARTNAYPWAVLLAFVGLSAWANSLHAPDDWTLRFVAALVPVSAALCWHLLVRPGLSSGWRRVLSRGVALGVFGYTMWASFGSLTAIGVRAGLHPPEALAAALDGLAVVAALSVWTHVQRAEQVPSAGETESETRTETAPTETETPAAPQRESAPLVKAVPTETRAPRPRPVPAPSRPPRLVETGAAKKLMRAHWDTERAAGRTPTGAALDRIGGTNNYGRGLVKEWLAEETATAQPTGAEA